MESEKTLSIISNSVAKFSIVCCLMSIQGVGGIQILRQNTREIHILIQNNSLKINFNLNNLYSAAL